jgi:transcriptional regulator with XRE-family HTH domain
VEVLFHSKALLELRKLSARDRVAILAAVEKLTELGLELRFPHSSQVKGANRLRELRPRAGRSTWRAFCRRIGDVFVIGSIGRKQLIKSRDVLSEQLEDPEFRREWERTAVARAVSLRLLKYRRDHSLPQTALARKLGMKQPAVARLEAGDHTPRLETLLHISRTLGIEFLVNIAPGGGRSDWLTKKVDDADVVQNVSSHDGEILVAIR